jgi:phosphoribosylanthranilate isomerase
MRPRMPGADVVKVKICGLTDPRQADACVQAGVWAIGVVLAPESPRYVDIARAAEVLAGVPDHVARVGVFVDADPSELVRAADRIGLTHVQLHGTGAVADARRATGLEVIVSIPFTGRAAVDGAAAGAADLVLFDAAVPGLHGGTGVRLDWTALAAQRPEYPFGLAGGLRPDNVAQAIRMLDPAVVDVSSGVESSPGFKDHTKVEAFMMAVRGA